VDYFRWVEAKGLLDLFGNAIWFGAGEVDFVEDGDHGQVFIVGEEEICDLYEQKNGRGGVLFVLGCLGRRLRREGLRWTSVARNEGKILAGRQAGCNFAAKVNVPVDYLRTNS
jgi:hypothetical protein